LFLYRVEVNDVYVIVDCTVVLECVHYTYLQEAQLLLGDRATRKHAKGCWNGRGNNIL